MRTVRIAVAATLACLLGCAAPEPERDETRKNLLVITVDTLRRDHLGCYGSSTETPALDRLAEAGFRFTDAMAPAPTTLPSHTSLFTGSYPVQHTVHLNGMFRVPAEAWTLAELLQAEGYRTAAFVGAAVLDRFYGLDQGFDTYDDDMSTDVDEVQKQRRAAEVSRHAIAWLENAEPPFFLWVHYFDPHGPYEPPAPYDTRYYDGDPRSPEHTSMQGVKTAYYQELGDITDIRYPLAQYQGEISYTDDEVGKVLTALAERGAGDSTLVLMTADHGESLGEDDYYFDHGENLHGSGLRVPLIVHAPWIGGGRAVEGPVSLIDVFPTVLELLGFDAMPSPAGRSLVPYLSAGSVPDDRPLFFETFTPQMTGRRPVIALQSGEWKMTLSGGQGRLFHLPSDPEETVNLAGERRDVATGLFEQLKTYRHMPALPEERIEMEPEQMEKLRALGYVN